MIKIFLTQSIKALDRGSSILRGLSLKIKITLLGGNCQSIPRVSASVVWKYPPHKGINISKGVDIGPGCYFDVPPGGTLNIGENVKLTGGVYISSLKQIDIGKNSLIAEYCSIRDSEHLTSTEKPINRQGMKSEKILIGEDVWICKGCTILGGATLAKGTVIGAHSLLKSIATEENNFYAGTPARKIKKRMPC